MKAPVAALLSLTVTLTACAPGTQPPAANLPPSDRPVDAADVQVPEGFRLEVVTQGLDYATDVAFGPNGEVFVSEAGGHTYGTEPAKAPPAQVLRVMPDGSTQPLGLPTIPIQVIRDAKTYEEIPEGIIAPITGITFNKDNGLLYIAHRTRVSTYNLATNEFRTIVDHLPAWGEFQNNKVIFGPDDKMYFFVSSQGNSGPVDEHMLKVLTAYNKPHQREIPCEDVELTGANFTYKNPFTPDPNDEAIYDAYVPFGVNVPPGTVIPGELKCNGAFYKANPDGSNLERIAWGFRSNFGYNFSPTGKLITSMNSGNPLEPRPVYDDWETLYEVTPGLWYGWPDYYSGLPITDPRFRRPNDPNVDKLEPHEFVLTPATRALLLKNQPLPPQPLVRLEPRTAAEGFVFGRDGFGVPEDDILLAQFGTVVPYERQESPGFRVVKVDLDTGVVADFLVNKSKMPASATKQAGLERPIQLAWGPDGNLYIVDFGVINVTSTGLNAAPNTGVLWRLVPDKR